MGIDAHAVLIGPREASDDALVLHQAREHGVEGLVHLLGPDPHIGGLLRQVDVLLLPSHREGLPGVVIEAAALGVPVVATALPGVEFIASRLSSILTVPLTAIPGEWAEVVRSAISSGHHDREPTRVLQRFEQSEFSLARSVEAHAKLYAGLDG
jgi:glycosyltransferase involved in cell wall biosynthesis